MDTSGPPGGSERRLSNFWKCTSFYGTTKGFKLCHCGPSGSKTVPFDYNCITSQLSHRKETSPQFIHSRIVHKMQYGFFRDHLSQVGE